jgi:hypothetical protein
MTEISPTEKRIDDLSHRVGRFEDRFERFEDKVDARFDKVDARLATVAIDDELRAQSLHIGDRFDRLEAHFDRWGKIVTGGVVTITASVVARVLGL